MTAAPADARALAALERTHDRLRGRWRRPFFDGLYVTWDDLVRDPAMAELCPHSHEGRFHPGGVAGDPVTWHTVAHYGVVRRGPQPADVGIWTDHQRLAAWTVSNLDGYWRRWRDRSLQLTRPAGLFALTPYAAVWGVTGVSRMHYTVATGDICSKEAACRHILATFRSRWHRVAAECLRLRAAGRAAPSALDAVVSALIDHLPVGTAHGERSLYPTPLHRRSDVLSFIQMAIEDVHRIA